MLSTRRLFTLVSPTLPLHHSQTQEKHIFSVLIYTYIYIYIYLCVEVRPETPQEEANTALEEAVIKIDRYVEEKRKMLS